MYRPLRGQVRSHGFLFAAVQRRPPQWRQPRALAVVDHASRRVHTIILGNREICRRFAVVQTPRCRVANVGLVGARLAREVDASVYLTPRVVSFAGKPRSNSYLSPLKSTTHLMFDESVRETRGSDSPSR